MARRRFTANDRGDLEDRDGHVLSLRELLAGEVHSVTVSLPVENAEVSGGKGEVVSEHEQQTLEQPSRDGGVGETPNAPVDEEIRSVWACYVAVMRPRNVILDSQARKIIREALKVSTADECCEAIQGCRDSAFHMGKNDRGRKYNRISQILKGRPGKETTRERIDYFIDLRRDGGQGGQVSSDRSVKVEALKDRVRRGNGDEDGKAAELQLAELGYTTKWTGGLATFSEDRS